MPGILEFITPSWSLSNGSCNDDDDDEEEEEKQVKHELKSWANFVFDPNVLLFSIVISV